MELVDLYTEDRIPMGRTAERHGKKIPGTYRTVIHVCIFNRRGQLLIQQRSSQKTAWPDLWDVSVGGGVEAGETSRHAAERETLEELGLSLDLSGQRPVVTVNFDGGFDDFYIVTQEFNTSCLTLQPEEVRQVRWVTLETLLSMEAQGVLLPYPRSFLCFLFEMRNRFGF